MMMMMMMMMVMVLDGSCPLSRCLSGQEFRALRFFLSSAAVWAGGVLGP